MERNVRILKQILKASCKNNVYCTGVADCNLMMIIIMIMTTKTTKL